VELELEFVLMLENVYKFAVLSWELAKVFFAAVYELLVVLWCWSEAAYVVGIRFQVF
jgi:hypothetical protein